MGVGESLARSLNVNDVDVPSSSGVNVNHRSMFLSSVSNDEVYDFLTRLDLGKSTLTNRILRSCSYSITFFLTICINECFSQGVYPDSLKVARVTPIYKGGDKQIPRNYQPISVLSSLNKIFERMISDRLVTF